MRAFQNDALQIKILISPELKLGFLCMLILQTSPHGHSTYFNCLIFPPLTTTKISNLKGSSEKAQSQRSLERKNNKKSQETKTRTWEAKKKDAGFKIFIICSVLFSPHCCQLL